MMFHARKGFDRGATSGNPEWLVQGSFVRRANRETASIRNRVSCNEACQIGMEMEIEYSSPIATD